MNNKAMGLSLFMAGIATYLVYSSVESIREETVHRNGTPVIVLVAKGDIKEMQALDPAIIEPKEIPKNYVEPDAISYSDRDSSTSSDLFKQRIKELRGAVALVPIKKGEQLAYNKVREPSLRTGLAPQVTPGKRAISITVDERTSVGKLVKPSDRVDVIAVIDVTSSGGVQRVARTILQDVAILAVGRSVTNNLPRKVDVDPSSGKQTVRPLADYDGYSSVTLEVEPAAAQSLALLSMGNSTLFLTLRNADDTDRTSVGLVTQSDILGDIRRPASATPPAPQGGLR